jgi:hypothetical protein
MIDHAVAGAGLDDLRMGLPRRLAAGGTLTPTERTLLAHADLLVLGALADEVRSTLIGDRVLLIQATGYGLRATAGSGSGSGSGSGTGSGTRSPEPVVCSLAAGGGVEGLREVAMARLTTPAGKSIAIEVARCGLHVAQVALGFGADVWIVGAGARRSLTGMSVDLEALVRRAGRIPQWVKKTAPEIGAEVGK